MTDFTSALTLTGIGTSIPCTSVINCSSLLAAGTYAVWGISTAAITVGATIGISAGTTISTALTTTTGFPIGTGVGLQPVYVNVPNNGQIAGIAGPGTVPSTLVYEKVG